MLDVAWMIGYIKHFDGHLKDGILRVGWVGVKTGDPVDDKDVRDNFEIREGDQGKGRADDRGARLVQV
jgi:3-oxoacyl-ACP reductase-like protein